MKLDTISKEQRDEILARCIIDSKFMAQLLFPESFFAPMTSLHDAFFDFIDNCKAKRKVIVATRGLGKTTISQFLCKKRILFMDRSFIGYLSNSSTSAQLITNNIKMDLASNQLVMKIFGDVRMSKVEGIDEKWAQTAFIANGMTMVLPRGAGQQVRGLLWNNKRPDVWLVDDLEDDIEIYNEHQRKKLREWFFGALMYTVMQFEDFADYEIVYVDTIKHQDALITYLMEDNDWEKLVLPACDDNYRTLAPGFISQETLDREVDAHRKRHTLDVFARERMCVPTSRESASFKSSYFKYYDENEPNFYEKIRPRLVNILIWDPSKTKNPRSAQSGFVVWGLDFEYNAYYVRQAIGEFLSVNEQHERVFGLAEQYNVQALGIEVTGLEEHILYPFKNECLRRGRPALAAKIVELKARTGKGELIGEEGGKDGRIRSLIPFYEQGLVWHNTVGCGPLEAQLLGFPRSKLKDISDAAAYISQMLEKGVRYMSPASSEVDRFNIEDEYRELDNEPSIRMPSV